MATYVEERVGNAEKIVAGKASAQQAVALAERIKNLQHAGRIQVLLLDARMPFVRVGGDALRDLREDVYDATNNTNGRVGLIQDSSATYAFALMGGEPYAVWN
jgi:CheY-like chemotaxis protein